MLATRNALITFLAVADEKSVHAAARMLNMTQPAITRQIQALERELGVAVFRRSVHGMTLTGDGEQFRSYAQEIIANARDAVAEVAEAVEGRDGHFYLGAGPAWVYEIVPEILARLYRQYPAVSVDLVSRISDYYGMLAEGELDMLVAEIPDGKRDPGIVYEPLVSIERHVFASAAHPLASRPVTHPRDLLDFPWVAFKDSIYGPAVLAEYFGASGLAPPEPVVSTTSIQTGLRMLRNSDYLMLLPGTLRGPLERLRVCPLATWGRFKSYRAGLMYPKWVLRLKPQATFRKLLIDYVSAHFELLVVSERQRGHATARSRQAASTASS